MPIGPNPETTIEGVPSVESILNLYRSIVNDSFDAGMGEINTDTAPWILPYLNSCTEDLYQDLGIVQDMRLIRDNLIVSLPGMPVTGADLQVSLTYDGYFDGSSLNPNIAVPPDLLYVMKLSQRPTGTGAEFCDMYAASDGLRGCYQGGDLGQYEVRGNNEIWMNGSTLDTDLKMRYEAVWQDIVAGVDFTNTYIPIQGSRNAIAFKMVAYYAQRLSPDQFSLAESQAAKYTKKLTTKSVLNAQLKEFAREPFEGENY